MILTLSKINCNVYNGALCSDLEICLVYLGLACRTSLPSLVPPPIRSLRSSSFKVAFASSKLSQRISLPQKSLQLTSPRC